MKRASQLKLYRLLSGVSLLGLLSVLFFFMIHNAHWLIGDEAIVIEHTGIGKAFSPLGFNGMASVYGRLYPFAYNLYNLLLPFFPDYVPVWAIYVLQAIALAIFSIFFTLIAFFLLREQGSSWKYATVPLFVTICIFRVYQEFITCYTGVRIVYLFLPVFLFYSCRFQEKENWTDGIVALVSINYISYCYETIFVVPLALGATILLFSFKHLTLNKKLFSWFLVGSGLMFLCIYAIFVLPKATGFYQHYGTTLFFQNAVKMFISHKIYWLALIVLALRFLQLIRKKSSYSFYDSLLLSGFAYFVGAAILKLDYTYYYNFGELICLTSILYFASGWLKPSWLCMAMLLLALFYGRKVPGVLEKNQADRQMTSSAMNSLSEQWESGVNFFWYSPDYVGSSLSYLDMRDTQRSRMEVYLTWLLHQDVQIPERTTLESGEKGIWLVYSEPGEDIPEAPELLTRSKKVFSLAGIDGYLIE